MVAFECVKDMIPGDFGCVRIVEMTIGLEKQKTMLRTILACTQASKHVDVGDV